MTVAIFGDVFRSYGIPIWCAAQVCWKQFKPWSPINEVKDREFEFDKALYSELRKNKQHANGSTDNLSTCLVYPEFLPSQNNDDTSTQNPVKLHPELYITFTISNAKDQDNPGKNLVMS